MSRRLPLEPSARDDPSLVLARLGLHVRRQMEDRATPGLAVALATRARTIAVATYGHADLAARLPVTSATWFEVGSIGKTFTAVLVLQLAAEGKLDLDAEVGALLPWFEVRSRFAPIRVRHLLSHTAGIIGASDFSPAMAPEVWYLRETEAGAPPGEWFHYSDAGYWALGCLIERLTGRPYAAELQSRILAPLGMEESDPEITQETRRRLAVGYRHFYDDRPAHRSHGLVPGPWIEYDMADASPAMTAGDLATFARMLLNGGLGPNGRILGEHEFGLLTRPVIEMGDDSPWPGRSYAFGLGVWEEDGHRRLGHLGGMAGGFRAAMLADATAGVAAVAMANGPGDVEAVAAYALDLLRADGTGTALPDVPPAPTPPDVVTDAGEYVGVYSGTGGRFELVADADRLWLVRDAERVNLERRRPGTFYAADPRYDRFLFVAERDEATGALLGLGHGGVWYARQGGSGPGESEAPTADVPADWTAFPGHYRSHSPWNPSLQVVCRRGRLLLVWPDGEEEALTEVGAGAFRVGADPRSPERLRFDTMVDGRALRARLNGLALFRVGD